MENPISQMDPYAEMQQRWHGWGSPVGLGIGLVCTGGFIALCALAVSFFM